MSGHWTIIRKSDGAVAAPLVITAAPEVHPAAEGCVFDDAEHDAIAIDGPFDPAVCIWTGTAWIEDPAKVEAVLVPAVKAANAAIVTTLYSTEFGKPAKYQSKQREVAAFRAIGADAFAALSSAEQWARCRFAMAQALLRGGGSTVAEIIAEFETALDAIENQVASLEAIELEAIAAVKAAATAADKRAIVAAIDWTWRAT
jgi:hypothetical protein